MKYSANYRFTLIKQVIIFSFIILLIPACKQTTKENQVDKDIQNKPYYFTGDYKEKIYSGLNIGPINSDENSFEIRIWSKVAIRILAQLTVIKHNKNGFSCFNYICITNYQNGNYFKPRVDSFVVYRRLPISKWNKFIYNLDKLKLFDLPEQDDVQGWKDKLISDGISYAIEFVYKGKYGIYHYHCPYEYTEYWNSKQMTLILDYLRKEIGFDEERLPPFRFKKWF